MILDQDIWLWHLLSYVARSWVHLNIKQTKREILSFSIYTFIYLYIFGVAGCRACSLPNHSKLLARGGRCQQWQVVCVRWVANWLLNTWTRCCLAHLVAAASSACSANKRIVRFFPLPITSRTIYAFKHSLANLFRKQFNIDKFNLLDTTLIHSSERHRSLVRYLVVYVRYVAATLHAFSPTHELHETSNFSARKTNKNKECFPSI